MLNKSPDEHYIYIPGFGDGMNPWRRLALRRWGKRRVTLVEMNWDNKAETYQQKLGRIIEAIERVPADTIILVGESAGGAMALFAFMNQTERFKRVITICGYNHGAGNIGAHYKSKRPAFYPLVREVDRLLPLLPIERRHLITTIYSMDDSVVAPEHSRIDGAKEQIIRGTGHLPSITRVLLAGRPV